MFAERQSVDSETKRALMKMRSMEVVGSPLRLLRFPSGEVPQSTAALSVAARCASTIQIVRPAESIAETQPQLHPALLRLLAMISQYLTAADSALLLSTRQRQSDMNVRGAQAM